MRPRQRVQGQDAVHSSGTAESGFHKYVTWTSIPDPWNEGAVRRRRSWPSPRCSGRVTRRSPRLPSSCAAPNLRQPGLKNLQAARVRAVSQPPFGQLSSCVPGCALREGLARAAFRIGRLKSDRSRWGKREVIGVSCRLSEAEVHWRGPSAAASKAWSGGCAADSRMTTRVYVLLEEPSLGDVATLSVSPEPECRVTQPSHSTWTAPLFETSSTYPQLAWSSTLSNP